MAKKQQDGRVEQGSRIAKQKLQRKSDTSFDSASSAYNRVATSFSLGGSMSAADRKKAIADGNAMMKKGRAYEKAASKIKTTPAPAKKKTAKDGIKALGTHVSTFGGATTKYNPRPKK